MPTTLAPGDIAIIGYNSDNPDSFAFVFLRDVEAGTTINFTDNGWQAAGGFRPGEGTATYTAPTDIAAGTVVSTLIGTMELNVTGDQIIAYQGTAADPTFLYAIDFADGNGAFAGDATSTTTSAIPTGLTLGVTAVALPFDNAAYAGPDSGSQLDLLEAISDTTNWTGSNVDRLIALLVFLAEGRPAVDLDFDNSTHGGRGFRTPYSQGGTSVSISDVDIYISDSDGDTLESATIRVHNPQPDYLLSVNGTLPDGITAGPYIPATGVLGLIGTASLTDYETAIGLIEFTSTSAAIGDQIRVDVNVFDGTDASYEARAFIDIVIPGATPSPVLDLDANNSNGGGADTTATFREGGPPIPIADVDVLITDADSTMLQSARIVLGINRQPEDVVSFIGPPGGPITASAYDPATGVLTLTGQATLAEYQTALRQVVYSNTSSTPFTGDRIFEVTVNDGISDSNIARMYMHVVDVAAVPPALDLDADNSTTPGANYLTGFIEGGPAVAIADADTDISDADSPNILSATIRLTNPQTDDLLAVSGGLPPGIGTTGYDPATGILTLTGSSSQANYEAALQQIVFSNASTTPSTVTRVIDIVVNDGGTNSNTATAFVQVEAVNTAAPVLDLDPDDSGGSVRTTFRTTFTENGVPVPIADADTSITDADSTELVSATITLTNRQAGDVLTVTLPLPDGIVVTSPYDPATGVLTLGGTATLEEYEVALQQILYSNPGEDPATLDRLIEVVVNDGENDSNVAAALIGVAAVNDPPVITVDASATYVENAAAVVLSPLAIVADADDTELTFAAVSITDGSFPGDGDVLTVNGATSGTIGGVTFLWEPALHTLVFNGTAPVATYQALLQQAEFQSSSDNPSDFNASPTRGLLWIVSDGATPQTATSTLNIVARNDPPSMAVAESAAYTENDAPVTVSPAANLADPDNLNITAGQVTISDAQPGDILTVNGLQDGTFAGIDFSYDDSTHSLVFRPAAPIVDYEAFLQAVQFHSTSDNPTNFGANPTRTLDWRTFDGRTFSTLQTTTLDILAINDTPVLANVPETTAYRRGDPAVLLAAGAAVADLDTPTLDQATVTITDVQAGDLLAADTAGTAITATYDAGTGTLTLTGPDTLANYQQVLGSVTFETTGGGGSRHLTWQLDDGEAANNLSTAVNSVITMGTSLHDFNGDGRSDIFWRSDDSLLLLWEMDGPNITDSTQLDITMREYWHVLDIADFNGDGRNDILWQDDLGVVVLWEMDGATIVDSAVIAGTPEFGALPPYWHFEGTGDLNGDGNSDILWRDDAGVLVLWEMNGPAIIGNIPMGNMSTDWQLADTGDYNGDGRSDLLWRHNDGTVRMWEMDGPTIIADTNLGVMPNHWLLTSDHDDDGDYNGDGNADLLWLDTAGEILMWQMDGPAIIGSTTVGTVSPTMEVIDSGDYNGDGNADILWRDGTTVSLWEMDGPNVLAMTDVATMPLWWQPQP
jgi:FG-GAP-like repeat